MSADDVHAAPKLVLITGATGRQGGATARAMLMQGWRVRALVRNPEAAAARDLEAAGAELATGDLEDRASLAAAVQGVHGVFSVQNYWGKGVGYDGEIRQARHLAEEASTAGVRHFVQASIADCDRAPGVEHFACKHEIEKLVDELGLPRTFLRTVFFMDNFLDPKVGKLMFPVLAGALRSDQPLHMVATSDVGRVAADVFAAPERYLGETLNVAGDALTVAEMRAAYERTTGKQPPRWRMPAWAFRLVNAEMAKQLAWNNEDGWRFAVDEVREQHPGVMDFEAFLRHRHGT